MCGGFAAAFLIISFFISTQVWVFWGFYLIFLFFFLKKKPKSVCVWNVQSAESLWKAIVWFLRIWNRRVIWTEKKSECVFSTFLRYAHFKKVLTETERQAINQLKTWVKVTLLCIVSITFPWMRLRSFSIPHITMMVFLTVCHCYSEADFTSILLYSTCQSSYKRCASEAVRGDGRDLLAPVRGLKCWVLNKQN